MTPIGFGVLVAIVALVVSFAALAFLMPRHAPPLTRAQLRAAAMAAMRDGRPWYVAGRANACVAMLCQTRATRGNGVTYAVGLFPLPGRVLPPDAPPEVHTTDINVALDAFCCVADTSTEGP